MVPCRFVLLALCRPSRMLLSFFVKTQSHHLDIYSTVPCTRHELFWAFFPRAGLKRRHVNFREITEVDLMSNGLQGCFEPDILTSDSLSSICRGRPGKPWNKRDSKLWGPVKLRRKLSVFLRPKIVTYDQSTFQMQHMQFLNSTMCSLYVWCISPDVNCITQSGNRKCPYLIPVLSERQIEFTPYG